MIETQTRNIFSSKMYLTLNNRICLLNQIVEIYEDDFCVHTLYVYFCPQTLRSFSLSSEIEEFKPIKAVTDFFKRLFPKAQPPKRTPRKPAPSSTK